MLSKNSIPRVTHVYSFQIEWDLVTRFYWDLTAYSLAVNEVWIIDFEEGIFMVNPSFLSLTLSFYTGGLLQKG